MTRFQATHTNREIAVKKAGHTQCVGLVIRLFDCMRVRALLAPYRQTLIWDSTSATSCPSAAPHVVENTASRVNNTLTNASVGSAKDRAMIGRQNRGSTTSLFCRSLLRGSVTDNQRC